MHVLLLSHRFSMSGAALMLLSLADLLLERGHRVTLTSMDRGDGLMRAAFAERGIPLVNPVRTDDVDVVVANTLPAAPSVIELAKRAPTIWWINESDYGFDLLLANPGWYEAFLNAHRIVCVGSVHPQKRQRDLILGVDRLGREDVEVALVGPVLQLEEDARTIVETAPDRYRLVGECGHAEAQGWLASADAVALVSGSEAHSLTAGEAVLAGVPLLSSDLPAMRSANWRHGHTCLMHPVGNVAILAKSIAFLLREPGERQRLGAAVGTMAMGYDFSTFERRMMNLISGLARRRVIELVGPFG